MLSLIFYYYPIICTHCNGLSVQKEKSSLHEVAPKEFTEFAKLLVDGGINLNIQDRVSGW